MILPDQYFDLLNLFLLFFLIGGYLYTENKSNFLFLYRKSSNYFIFLLMALPIIIFLGLRPVNEVFGDMSNYERYFTNINSDDIAFFHNSDILFKNYIKVSSKIMSVKTWFFVTTFITIALQFWAIKRLFPNAVFIFFLASICSLTFFGPIVNGIRIGLATSVFFLGLSFYKKRYLMFVIFVISIGLHKSMLLPAVVSVLTIYFNYTKLYIYIWIGALIISLFSSSILSEIFNKISFVDSRLDLYDSSKINPSKFSIVGFRYDFLLYSVVPIALGYYYIVKQKMQNSNYVYVFLLNTYIITNAFWILIIEANYSNRFASLSWIIWPFIMIYPILYISKNQYRVLIAFLVIFVELAVTYLIS